MTVVEPKAIDRQIIHKAIDELPPESLTELASFIGYLRYKLDAQPGSQWAKELYDLFAPVREAASSLSSDEIDQLLDEELEAVRRERNP